MPFPRGILKCFFKISKQNLGYYIADLVKLGIAEEVDTTDHGRTEVFAKVVITLLSGEQFPSMRVQFAEYASIAGSSRRLPQSAMENK
jgi:hypothetical protein